MTWDEFIDAVDEHLSVDAQRRGLEAFRARMARNAVADLQRYITAYQAGHTTTYEEADLEVMEHAMLGNLPAGATPHAFYIISTKTESEGDAHPDCHRNRLDFWKWEKRRELVCNPCARRVYAYALAPQGRMFLIHPALNDETELLLVWQGIKLDFGDDDEVPFPEQAAEAVAAYIKWRILLEIDKNPALAQTQYAIFVQKRTALYREEQEKQDAEKSDQEYSPASAPAAPADNW